MTYRDIDPKLAGIYIFKNNINGKCYVGQSVKLRSRIKDHLRNMQNHKLDLPIYRAIWKYGWHNFTLDILESFIPDPSITNEELIKELDQLEIKYIEEYEAYTKGYNCTKGGDYGVLGLKMTPEQKKKVSEANKRAVAEGKCGKRVYMYNYIDKYYIYAWTITNAASITGLSRSNIGRLCNNNYIHLFCNNFIAAYTQEELEEKKKRIPEELEKIKLTSTSRTYTKDGRIYKGNSTWVKGMVSFNKGKKMSEEQKLKIKKSLQKYNVLQYDKDYRFITRFNSVEEAARSVNTDDKSIRRACKGEAKTCKGYIWEYELKQPDRKQAA